MKNDRKRCLVRVVLCCAAFLAAAIPASAEPVWSLGVRAGAFEGTGASDLWDALYEGDTMTQIGIQGQVEWPGGFYLALAVDTGSVDGQLVSIDFDGSIITSDIDSELTLMPYHLTAGWIARPDAAWSVFFGGGPTLLDWEDEIDSPFIESTSGSDVGLHAVTGVRRVAGSWAFAGELRWSTIDALGEGGVSAALSEDDLGGVGLHLSFSYRFGG